MIERIGSDFKRFTLSYGRVVYLIAIQDDIKRKELNGKNWEKLIEQLQSIKYIRLAKLVVSSTQKGSKEAVEKLKILFWKDVSDINIISLDEMGDVEGENEESNVNRVARIWGWLSCRNEKSIVLVGPPSFITSVNLSAETICHCEYKLTY